jgi:hypothetical protein
VITPNVDVNLIHYHHRADLPQTGSCFTAAQPKPVVASASWGWVRPRRRSSRPILLSRPGWMLPPCAPSLGGSSRRLIHYWHRASCGSRHVARSGRAEPTTASRYVRRREIKNLLPRALSTQMVLQLTDMSGPGRNRVREHQEAEREI